ncbi:MAG: hypothetical protein H0X40_16190 [Chthoniobacterales bacterium]|nr:hypothetical protein [Chthoniobacterales bacterium]
MEPSARPLEIFAPFGEAFELTKKILFQPFDFPKWLAIGLGAWLATFFGGGFHYQGNNANWKTRYFNFNEQHSLHNLPPWVIPVAIIGTLFIFALVALFLWLNARGRFMFTDCIVRNRGAVAEPWREYRAEANSFFVFQLVIAFCAFLLFGGLAVALMVSWYWTKAVSSIVLFGALLLVWILLMILVSLVTRFMVPVMYRRRCGATEAFRVVWPLVMSHLGVFILFVLFNIVLYLAAMILSCLAGCLTCCIAALPYVGTVVLLPVVMTLFAFPLCFIRQFGDDYDVWAVVRPVEPLPPTIPPVQDNSPPL